MKNAWLIAGHYRDLDTGMIIKVDDAEVFGSWSQGIFRCWLYRNQPHRQTVLRVGSDDLDNIRVFFI